MLLLCSLIPIASLADSEPSDEVQAPAAETTASAAAPVAAVVATSQPAASAATPARPPAAAATAAAAEPEEDMTIVCKSERNIGTRFEKKTCQTRSAWQRIEKAAEEDFGAVRNRQIYCLKCTD
jgi:hypothetical protein